MINSRKIDDLHPFVADKCRQFIELCESELGIDVLIICTYRDNDCQAALYAKGRTRPGRKVTRAPAGYSYHNYGLAFDFAPLENGKIDWNDVQAFKRCGEIAKSLGLEYGGDWWRFRDWGHCQFTAGLTLDELASGAAIQCK